LQSGAPCKAVDFRYNSPQSTQWGLGVARLQLKATVLGHPVRPQKGT